MISLGGLVSQKAFGKFEMGKVISNPFANAFIKEAEGEDHEVSMANNSLDTIIKMATELKAKMGENEKDIPAWIQDHITNAANYISQASTNYHEYGQNESIVNEDNTAFETLMLIRNLEQTNKLLAQDLKTSKRLPNDKKENIKKSIVVNQGLINYYKENFKNLKNNESVNEATGREANELMVKRRMGENILKEDLTALGLLIPALGALIGGGLAQLYPYFTGHPNIYTNIKDWWKSKKDNSEMNKIANRIKNDPEVQEFLKKKNKSGWQEMLKKKLSGSELNYLNKIYRSRFNNESINEASPCWKGYKQVGMKDKGGKQVPNCVPTESVVKEISGRVPQIFLKTGAVEKKIKELMADRKKAVVPYNSEKDPKKKEILKQILIKLTKQIQGYEKNLVQLRDKEEEYIQQMQADAELDTSAFD